MDFAEKLQQIIKFSGQKTSAFANSIGIDKGMISKYLNVGNQPSYTVLVNILNKYPEISAEWLMRGTGEMLLNGETAESNSGAVEEGSASDYQAKFDEALKTITETESKLDKVRLEFYMKDNNRLQIELQELKNKMAKLEERNLLLQNKLIGVWQSCDTN